MNKSLINPHTVNDIPVSRMAWCYRCGIRVAGFRSVTPKHNKCTICHFKETLNKDALPRELTYFHYVLPFPKES